MTSPAAFRATYSDWKLIRSRKVVQIILEVPLEASGDAYEVLGGMPNPGEETWCAVARLNEGKEGDASARGRNIPVPETSPASDSSRVPARAKFVDKLYAEQSGILCNDPKFWTFLRETHPTAHDVKDKDICAEWVRFYCDVQSRSEIRPSTVAGTRWELLVSAFRVWDLAPSVGAA